MLAGPEGADFAGGVWTRDILEGAYEINRMHGVGQGWLMASASLQPYRAYPCRRRDQVRVTLGPHGRGNPSRTSCRAFQAS